ncbi:hypothetical protein ATM97_29190 [Nocardia sp. MH4]|uniref:Uncharacterized protein n=1 Tax=Nocardia fluminea TaxID=134984 RepID=A0A2N3VD95_9NOCA|nr:MULTISPECIES: hypothetical protein [Nocardia]MBW0275353.1 hypothetical protein [Nocardia sp. MH4]PKV79567.1 hypothetical protein ATK86_3963 [Nocardia fluminea]
MPNNPEDFTTRITGTQRDLVIVGHVLTHDCDAPQGAVVTPFPEIDFHQWTRTSHEPVALVLSYWDQSVVLASPEEMRRPPDASSSRFTGSLVPVWFHRPSSQLVLAPHYFAGSNKGTAPIPAGVRAHLPHAPDTINNLYNDLVK